MPENLTGRVGPKTAVTGQRAVCASQSAIVTGTMRDVLASGGNAIDAAIAGALVQATVQQDMTNHAGMVTALVYEAKSGRIHQLNSMGTLVPDMPLCRPVPPGQGLFSPAGTPGPCACIPGFMPGLKALYEKFATRPWSELCGAAIQYADEGYILDSFQNAVWAEIAHFYLYTESGREWLTPNGFLPQTGDRFCNPALAKTLTRLSAEGPDYFTTGEWAQHFVERANKVGWGIKLDHLSAIPPRWQEPVHYAHRGYEIVQQAAPERQGVFCAIVLGILDQLDVRSLGHYTESAEALYYFGHALRRAHWETGLLNDPEIFDVPLDTWLSPDYLRMCADILRRSKPKLDMTNHFKLSNGPAALAAVGIPVPAGPASNGSGKSGMPERPEPPAGSCELTIVDEEGNWVQLMNTLQSGGIPGEVVDGVCMTGSHQMTHMASPIAGWLTGGGRMRCVIGNTFVLKGGKPWLALGTPGNVHCTIPQVLSNILDYDMDIYDAVDAPRMDILGDDYSLEIESRIPPSVTAGLAGLGILAKPLPRYDYHMGSFQVSWRDDSGALHCTSDPRRAGCAAAL